MPFLFRAVLIVLAGLWLLKRANNLLASEALE